MCTGLFITVVSQVGDVKEKIIPRVVVLGRNEQGSFGLSIAGGIEDDLLPSVKTRPDMPLRMYARVVFLPQLCSVLFLLDCQADR